MYLVPRDPLIPKFSNFRKGSYCFTEDLMALESAFPPLHSVPVSTPLHPEAWDRALQSIPDRAFHPIHFTWDQGRIPDWAEGWSPV